jgi:hypothetical protein
LPQVSHAGTNLVSTSVVGGNTGWFSTGVWKTNDGTGVGVGTAVNGPVAGNTYTLMPNGVAIGNNVGETRTRNLYTNGTPTALWTFPGDSLELRTNTEIRFKQIATPATPETVNFPGVGGNPGLILNGGMLNIGDAIIQPVSGLIQAVPGTESYICPGNNDGASVDAARAFNIFANIVGSGRLVIFEAGTTNPQRISSTNNTYSGTWLVKAGVLLGAAPGSLGTNSNFIMDPNYVLPVPPFSSTAPVVDVAGPAFLEANYDLNSAGTLTLVNGGKMRLHQNCAFTAVTIEGFSLEPGTHYYSELATRFANNFDTTGSGAITVQPYGNLPALGPLITTQPGPQNLYAGRTAHFSVVATANGAPPLTYQWQRNGTNFTDGGNISGVNTSNLTVSSVSAPDVTTYRVVVSNAAGFVISSNAALSIVSPSGEAYEAAVIAANPYAFYQLNGLVDPATNGPAFDYAGGFNGNYGTGVANGLSGIAGPRPTDAYPGFDAANYAASFTLNGGTGPSRVTVTPWNLNTNIVTLTAWINPSGAQNASEAIVFCRGGNTVAGINYTANFDIGGNSTLGYTWNNEGDTFGWNSGISAPSGIWSFVALVVTPTNATLHLMNTNGLLSATHVYPHEIQGFAGTTLIGDDSNDGGNNSRTFNGIIDDVGIFNRALSKSELFNLFSTASGVNAYAPIIASQPTSLSLYVGQTASFSVSGGGSDPLTFQWQSGPSGGPYSNMGNGGRISGTDTANLVISNIVSGDSLDYLVILSNGAGSVTSSVATLTVNATGPAENITMGVQQAAGLDWDSGASWSDGNPASVSAAAKPGSTYELLAGGRLRTPLNPRTAVFPGDLLTIDGDGVWNVNPAAGATIGEIRFKQPTYGSVNGTVVFKKLVMNGGQLDVGNDGMLIIGGEINIRTNAPFNNDNNTDRGYRIDARLTGSGNIEYHGYNLTAFQTNFANNLNIAGTNNTYSGTWNVVIGTLLATGTNSLGTNDIVVGANGAFEPVYDMNNTNANLFLNGRMYLHQNHTFKSVFINGAPLNNGTYTFAQLNAAYPTRFPATWTPQNGATNFSTGSGSITVLITPAPTISQQPVSASLYPSQTASFTVAANGTPPLFYKWRKNNANLTDGGRISGSDTTNLVITNIVAGDGGNYTVVVTNSIGSVTSAVATLTVLPTGPPLNLTLNYGGAPIVQAQNLDWNTPTNWSDGNPASTSALANPGSTYEVVAGARLRSPAGATAAVFPGIQITVDGDGVFTPDGPNVGEIRFKHADGGTIQFQKLIMAGGMLDNGDNGTMGLLGEFNVISNAIIYVDSAAGQDRTYRIDAWLTGNGSIEWHQFSAALSGRDLNITGTTNTYTGTWNIVQGAVVGGAPGSLGTNSITVGASGALETLYDLNSPNATLTLDGQMFLHQNDTFKNVTVAGTPLSPGTYTFNQLTGTYPLNFPATWAPQDGSSTTAGSGSITVIGSAPPPVTINVSFSGGNLTLTWSQGTLLEATNVYGPWVTNGAPSPYTVAPTGPQKFFRVQTQ